MARLIHMAIFLSIFSLILGGAHYYIFARLSHYLTLTDGSRKFLAALMIALPVLTVAALPLVRMLPRTIGTPIAWVFFTWMGVLLFLTLALFAADVIYTTGKIATPATALADPARRIALQKIFGFAALGATGLLSGFAFWKALRPVAVKPLRVELKKLPVEMNGLRIAQLTDLHLGPTIDGKWLRGVVEKTNALNPDIVAITGDLVDGSVEELGGFASVLKDLRSKYGVFFITGNHEYYSGVEQWLAFLPTLNITVLRNQRMTLDINGQKIDIAGIDDFSASEFPGHGPDLPKALAGRDAETPVILLAHQPRAVLEAAKRGVDLQLSGHTHGGQIWPWNFLVPLQQPYVAGLHRHPGSDTQIYVSDGTGYWGPPMRLGTTAEITDITLYRAA